MKYPYHSVNLEVMNDCIRIYLLFCGIDIAKVKWYSALRIRRGKSGRKRRVKNEEKTVFGSYAMRAPCPDGHRARCV